MIMELPGKSGTAASNGQPSAQVGRGVGWGGGDVTPNTHLLRVFLLDRNDIPKRTMLMGSKLANSGMPLYMLSCISVLLISLFVSAITVTRMEKSAELYVKSAWYGLVIV